MSPWRPLYPYFGDWMIYNINECTEYVAFPEMRWHQVAMATSRITIRTIDYHKFRSLVIERDGIGDELRERCDRDVSAMCDAVRRLYDRRERFSDDCDGSGTSRGGDLARFGEICGWYKLILESRRVRPVDVRLRSGWWQVGPCSQVPWSLVIKTFWQMFYRNRGQWI